ncbi:MAG: hypothetical protein ABJD53_15885 [Gammaproteobacteria bacterium]
MAPDGNIEYALTRVQADYGRRLGESAWRRLESSHDLGQYLDAVRTTELAGWVAAFDKTRDSHAIERHLRLEWQRHVAAVAAWHPHQWQAWLLWLGWLPSLSLLAQLARAEPAPAWMMTDPVWGPIAQRPLGERAVAFHGTALDIFQPALDGSAGIGALWRSHWRTLAPRTDAHTQHLLAAVLRALDNYGQRLAGENTSAAARQQLTERLNRLFRAGAGTVAATLCYLALLAMDLERLRGGLVSRCLFAVPTEEAA